VLALVVEKHPVIGLRSQQVQVFAGMSVGSPARRVLEVGVGTGKNPAGAEGPRVVPAGLVRRSS
jgi:hypothetical protein